MVDVIFPEESVSQEENKQDKNLKLKIIGCGGAGSNTISKIFKSGIDNVETYIINTDAGSLRYSSADNRILVGKGFGCGGNVDKAREIINKDIDKIKNVVKDSKALILTAGMGGGTGSACVCEIAKIAKELDIPTIAVVTKPFKVEGNSRIDSALNGIEELKKYTNFVFIIEDDKVYKFLNSEINYAKLYEYIDDILKITIEEINNLINFSESVISIAVEDLKNIGKENFVGLMLGTGQTLKEAIYNALDNKMFGNCDFEKVKNVLMNVSYEKDSKFTIDDTNKIVEVNRKIFPNCKSLKYGNMVNSNLKDEFRVLIMFS